MIAQTWLLQCITALCCVLASSAGSEADVTTNTKTPQPWQEQWQQQAQAISVQGAPLTAILGPALDYQYKASLAQLQKGLIYTGANHRLRRVMRRLMQQQHGGDEDRPVRVGVVGGSISWGHGASRRGETDWFAVVSAWLVHAFPNANVTTRNGCLPATPSALMVSCLEQSVDEDVDLVFVEYLLNDGFVDGIERNRKVRIYERLVRRIMSKANKPAVVLLQTLRHGQFHPRHAGAEEWRPFHATLEDVYGAVAQYYGAPWLSQRGLMYHTAQRSNFSAEKYFLGDYLHPNDLGHKLLADAVVWLLQSTATQLLLHPPLQEELEALTEALPDPMHPGNEHSDHKMCMQGHEVAAAVLWNTGWNLTDEGKHGDHKWGYIATQPGAVLTLSIETDFARARKARQAASTGTATAWHDTHPAQVLVLIGYLKSYEHMGIATARCVSGCSCEDKLMDGTQSFHESTVYVASLVTQPAQNCTITVTVEQQTSDPKGEHKVKVTALMLSEFTQGTADLDNNDWQLVSVLPGGKA